MMPARYISAITSMMPEPQTPVMPLAAIASSKPGSSDHRSEPITLKRGSSVSRSMRTRSIAPGAARCPQLICAPSKAGPVGLEQATSRCAVAEHDFGVGADIDQQRQLVGRDRAARRAPCRRHPHRRDRRCTAARRCARCGCSLKSMLAGAQRERVIGGERERRAAELDRIDAEQQVMHDRIADQRHLEDVRHARCCASRATSAASVAERLAHRRGHQRAPPGFIIE